jgi:hypothetical protein
MMNLLRLCAASLLALAASTAAAQQSDPEPGSKFPMLDQPEGTEPPADAAPKATTGSLAVHAVQGTPGGPAIGAAKLRVDLVHRGMIVHTIEDTLDEHGVLMLENLPLEIPVQPIVSVEYAGLSYQQVGATMDAQHPQQQVEVKCYEKTTETPAWRVRTRHAMLSAAPQGVKVTELLSIENPASQTWVGIPGRDDEPVTTVFRLPVDAEHVSVGRGFHEGRHTTLTEGMLINHLPLMPGQTTLQFSYVIHVEGEDATIELVSPAEVDQTMVVVPDAIKVAGVQGLSKGGSSPMGDSTAQMYLAANTAAGQPMTIRLAPNPSATEAATRAPTEPIDASPNGGIAKYIGLVGGGLIIVIGIIIIFARSAKSPKSADA